MIAHLFDATVRVWRHSEAADSFEAVSAYTPLAAPTQPNAYVGRSGRSTSRTEAGQRPTERPVIFMDADADVQRFDVVQVLDSPDGAAAYRVIGLSRPRWHHTELDTEPFTHTLEEA